MPYFLEISPWQDFISRCCTMRWQFESSIYRDRHARAYTASIVSLFVYTYNVRARTYIVVNPVPYGNISRAMGFQGAARFRGNRYIVHTSVGKGYRNYTGILAVIFGVWCCHLASSNSCRSWGCQPIHLPPPQRRHWSWSHPDVCSFRQRHLRQSLHR